MPGNTWDRRELTSHPALATDQDITRTPLLTGHAGVAARKVAHTDTFRKLLSTQGLAAARAIGFSIEHGQDASGVE
jgi:hypothetical protein